LNKLLNSKLVRLGTRGFSPIIAFELVSTKSWKYSNNGTVRHSTQRYYWLGRCLQQAKIFIYFWHLQGNGSWSHLEWKQT